MNHLLRVQKRKNVMLDEGYTSTSSRPLLLGFAAVGLGLLGVVVNLLDVAPVPYGLSLATGGAGGLFLLMRGRKAERIARPAISERSVLWLSVLNLVITNAVLFLSFHSEKRPSVVFFLITAQAGLIAVQVFLAQCSSPRTGLMLGSQVVLLHIGSVLGRLLVFPELGSDTWPQKFFAQLIVDSGHFPVVDTAYKGYPFWPSLIGTISMLTGRSEQEVLLAVSLAFSTIALWLLLFGLQRLFGYRQSLIVGLVLSVSGWFVYWASLAVPMVVTIALFNAILVLLFRRQHGLQLPLTICLLVLLAASSFYHPMASVASTLLLVTTALMLWWLSRPLMDENQRLLSMHARRAAVGTLFAVVLALSAWMYLGDTLEHLVLTTYRSIMRLEPLSFRGGYRSTLVYELDYLGFHLVLLLALARFMRWWVKPVKSAFEITLLGGALLFLGINYVTVVADAFFALPHRWLVYASTLLAFPAAIELWSLARARISGLVLSSLLIMALAFAAITNTGVSGDNPMYGEEVAFMQSMTVSEVAVLDFIDQHRVNHIGVDWQVSSYFGVLENLGLRPPGSSSQFLMYHETDRGIICPDRPSTLPEAALVRQIYPSRRIGATGCVVEESGLRELDQAPNFVRVFDSGEAILYRRIVEERSPSGSQE